MFLLMDFFKTRTTWTETYGTGNSWNWFGLTHILILLTTVVFCLVMSYFYRKGDEKKRNILRWVVTGLMLAEEVWMFTISIATKQFEIGFLPLHLCGINIFFCIAYSIKQKDWIAELLYGVALPGAFMALIVPTWTAVPAWNFIFIFSTGYHIFLICYPIMLLAGGYKPDFRKLWKGAVVLVGLCIVIFFINLFNNHMAEKTGDTVFWSSNFMFLNYPESLFKTIADLLHMKGRLYIITLPVLLASIWAIFYTPWVILEKVNKKKELANA